MLNINGILVNYSKLKGTGNTLRKEGWKKPAAGVYKLNVDAAYDPNTGKGATGAIIRDAGGNFIAACCDFNDVAIDVASMEASALIAGLMLAEQYGGHSWMVESDSMDIVEAILNPAIS